MTDSDASRAAAGGFAPTNHDDRAVGDADLRLMFESLGDGIYGIDRHGRCTFVNQRALALLGYDGSAEVVGRHMHDLIHRTRPDGSPYPAHDCPMLRTLSDGEPVVLDDELLWRRDGTSFFAEYASHPMTVDGAVVGGVVRFEDLSSKRQARQRLAVQQEVSQILGGEVEVADALDRVLAAIGSGFGWDAGALWLSDAARTDGAGVERAASWSGPGTSRDAAAVADDARPHVLAALDGARTVVASVAPDPDGTGAHRPTLVAFPIRIGGDGLGSPLEAGTGGAPVAPCRPQVPRVRRVAARADRPSAARRVGPPRSARDIAREREPCLRPRITRVTVQDGARTRSMRNYAAEALGTFVLVFGGCGAAVLAGTHIGFAGVAAAFGLSLLVMVYAVGPISGCHLNPAVTLGLVLANKFDPRRAPGYMVAQVLGAIAAAAVLYLVASGRAGFDATASGFATNGYGDRSPDHYGLLACFVSEVVMTGLLMFVILGATDIKAPVGFAGIAIGLALSVIHLVSIPVTNTSVNPARSIGPALFAGGGAFAQLWLFIIAPCVGAAAAALVYTALRSVEPETQITMRAAIQALPTEQGQRIDHAVANPPVPPAKR